MRACSGAIDDPASLGSTCELCDYYVINAQQRDWEKVDSPV